MLLWSDLFQAETFCNYALDFLLYVIFVFVFWCFFEPPLSVLHIVSFFHFFLHILGLFLISTKRQKCEIWSALHLTLWEKLPQTLMKKIGSLRELSAPEHFVVVVVVLKTQSALGITLDVNSMAVILSPPPLPIPPLLTDGQTRKKQAHGWISIRPRWRIEEKVGKKNIANLGKL